MTKDELIDQLENSREAFLNAIEGLGDEDLQAKGVVGDWSIKDTMAHLVAWEAEMVKLLWQAQQGENPSSAHFSGQSDDSLNAAFHALTRDRPLERVLDDFAAVRKQTIRRLEAFKATDLGDPLRFPWLNHTPLWKWIADSTFTHENEHAEQVRAWRAVKKL